MGIRDQRAKTSGYVRVFLAVALLPWAPALTFGQAQDPQNDESVVDAARAARQRALQPGTHSRVLTNDDFPARHPSAPSSSFPLGFPENAQLDLPASVDAGCYDAATAQALGFELQAAKDDRDRLESDLSDQSPVISGNDLDLKYYKPGYSGISVGSPPLQESQPQPAARVDLAALDERIASLEKSLQLACEPPEAAAIQRKLDAVAHELDLSQKQLALDQDNIYLNPGYTRDTAGQASLDAEQEYIDALAAEKAQLEAELSEAKDNQPSVPPSNEEQQSPQTVPTQVPQTEP